MAPDGMHAIEIPSVRDKVSSEEWEARVNLACAYRLVDHFGWTHLTANHISLRVPGEEEHFLLNPYGLFYDEVTASSLIKIDLDGNKIMESEFGINQAGYVIHSAIHAARKDVTCALHTHTEAGMAVSAQKGGLLPLSMSAIRFHDRIAYHDYEGVALREDEKARLVADLADKTYLILRNHGTLAVGASVADAFLHMFVLERACRIQALAQSGGASLIQLPASLVEGIMAQAEQATNGLGGQIAWPGLLRKLDRLDASFRD